MFSTQVATQRVKTAQKAEIPHIDEPVSKIENVGVQTQNKLQDIKAAAEQIGVHGLSVVHNCITTGQLACLRALFGPDHGPDCISLYGLSNMIFVALQAACATGHLTPQTWTLCGPHTLLGHRFEALLQIRGVQCAHYAQQQLSISSSQCVCCAAARTFCSLKLFAFLMLQLCHSGAVNVPCVSPAAVGQFKELVESSETDQPLQETLKKVLNFTSNGWHKAREHAMRAVSTDNRMRAWCADDSLEDGLLFKCYLGRVDLEAPVGMCCLYPSVSASLLKPQGQDSVSGSCIQLARRLLSSASFVHVDVRVHLHTNMCGSHVVSCKPCVTITLCSSSLLLLRLARLIWRLLLQA